MIEWWQHIPEHLNPIAFTVGFFSVRFYALFFFGGFLGSLGFFLWRTWKYEESGTMSEHYDLFLTLFLGALLGGRLGFLLLYRPDLLLENPFGIIVPYNFSTGVWTGISGMSFHGGLLGVVIALFLFTKHRGLHFFTMADRVSLVVPIALFFGRLGNFFNQELFGRVTDKWWGMYVPDTLPTGVLRHPSPLYEAFGEGVVLFWVLWWVGQRVRFSGGVSAWLIVGYGIIRFILEYFREPDVGAPLPGGVFTLGQVYSFFMIVFGTVLFLWLRKKNRDTLGA